MGIRPSVILYIWLDSKQTMSPEKFQRVRERFDAALERDPGQRTEFVERACEGDEALWDQLQRLLIAHNQTSGFMEKTAVESATASLDGCILGSYQLLSRIGEGGM